YQHFRPAFEGIMGVDAHGLNCLRYAKRFGAFGDTVTVGRQNIHLAPQALEALYGAEVDWKQEAFCETLLMRYFGARKVDSVDNSGYEGATLIHDMNQPLPASSGEYDTVVELGTVEHIFNVSQALANMIALCREGGQILHV